jgi:hypothetical protein
VTSGRSIQGGFTNNTEATQTILLELKARVEEGGDGCMYGDRGRAIHDLDALLASPSAGRLSCLLMPTANLQELSIECGWGSEFNRLAAELDRLREQPEG